MYKSLAAKLSVIVLIRTESDDIIIALRVFILVRRHKPPQTRIGTGMRLPELFQPATGSKNLCQSVVTGFLFGHLVELCDERIKTYFFLTESQADHGFTKNDVLFLIVMK